MKLRGYGLQTTMAFALATLLGSAPSLAQFAYITNGGSNTVSVLDTAKNKVVATIGAGAALFSIPWGVAVTPDGSTVYVGNGGGFVSVIDTQTGGVSQFSILVGPQGVAVSPDGKRLFVANEDDAVLEITTVLEIDTGSGALIARIPVRDGPNGVAVTPDSNRVYVASTNDNAVWVIDAGTGRTSRIPVGTAPFGVAIAVEAQET